MTQLITTIVAATVYPDRARLTRRGSIELQVGTHSLEITELPLALNPDSLRTSARGTAPARLLGAEVKRTFYVETPSEKVRQMEQGIEKLKDELKRLDAQAELIKQNRTNLDKLAGQVNTFALALAAKEMTVEQQLALFDNLRRQAEKLDSEALGLQVTRRDTDSQLQKLTKELEQLRSSRPRERYSAIVEVDVLEPGALIVEISYLVSGAGWEPLYDLRLIEKDGISSLEVGYLAQVTQNTGEAWEAINLTLSTARPALAHTLPELDPWYIAPFENIRPMARAMMQPAVLSMGKPKEMGELQAPEASNFQIEEAAEEVTAVVDMSGASVTYVIPGSTSIPQDGAPHKVTVARFPLSPRMDYVTAPKLAQAVYRRAKVDNDSPYTFLPGDANIFIVDEYIGTAPLELTAPQGELELYLGNEDRIKVERELKRRDIDKRFIGGKRHMAFGYEIKLENLLPVKASLTLHDQFPVQRHEEIKVKLESADPMPKEQTELNLLKWEFSLEPKEKRTVRFDFSVETPQGMEIIGLP
jgi:uncharacterized protein (TIGR02231 family)